MLFLNSRKWSRWPCCYLPWCLRSYILQDLLDISEYDLLELGVHNHLHRLHLLTSLHLLQERERRKGIPVHTQTVPLSFLIIPISFFWFWLSGLFESLKFPSLSQCCRQTERQRLIACHAQTRLCLGGLVVWWGLSGGGQYCLSHTHIDTQSHTRTLLKVSVSREERWRLQSCWF